MHRFQAFFKRYLVKRRDGRIVGSSWLILSSFRTNNHNNSNNSNKKMLVKYKIRESGNKNDN